MRRTVVSIGCIIMVIGIGVWVLVPHQTLGAWWAAVSNHGSASAASSGVDGVGAVASASGPATNKAPPIIIPPPPGATSTGTPTAGGAPAPSGATLGSSALELCHDATYWLPTISQWAVPPGCYGQIYAPDQANYPNRPAWGYCNWWVEELHPTLPGYDALQLPHHNTPLVGAAMWFAPGEQGASSSGHYAEVVAINPDGYWLLISEMNDAWRGSGFGRVNYRYVHLSAGVTFLY